MGRIADPVVKRFAARYLPNLRRRYRPELVLAFGSRVRGEALAGSDLDLLVVSERFRGVPFLERASNLLIDFDLPFATDLLCYTPDEFARKRRELGIVSQALEDGLPL
jgi:predicted nucleotidyltransferase